MTIISLTGILFVIIVIWISIWAIQTRGYLCAWAIINGLLTAAGLLIALWGAISDHLIPSAILGGFCLLASVLQFAVVYYCKTNAPAACDKSEQDS